MTITNKARRGPVKRSSMRGASLSVVTLLAVGAVSAYGQSYPQQGAQSPYGAAQSQMGAGQYQSGVSANSPGSAQSALAMSTLDAAESSVLHPGDTVTVQVFNTPELSGTLRVDQSGKITLPIGTEIHVDGMSPAEAGKAIEKALRDQQIMYSPLVNVAITGYATETVTITGDIRGPGIYPLRGSRRLSDSLALAGWLNITTGSTIEIAHRGDVDHPFVINTADPNFNKIAESTIVQSGDTVRVAKADQIYVIGDVRAPGVYPMPNGQRFSVMTVLALCGGTTLTSKSAKASIIRPTATGADTIPINVDLITKNEAPNITLQPSDVLVIPRSGWKAFEQIALPNLTGAVASAASSALVIR